MLASDGRNMVSETTDSALTRISVRRHGGVLAEESMGGHPGRQAQKSPRSGLRGRNKRRSAPFLADRAPDSLYDGLAVHHGWLPGLCQRHATAPRFRSEEPTLELQSLMRLPYAVCCLKKKK